MSLIWEESIDLDGGGFGRRTVRTLGTSTLGTVQPTPSLQQPHALPLTYSLEVREGDKAWSTYDLTGVQLANLVRVLAEVLSVELVSTDPPVGLSLVIRPEGTRMPPEAL